jgi:hypothetical protein
MANGSGVTSFAFIGLMLGAVLVYVLYRIITLEKQVREAALVQADKIRLLIDEQIETAIAAALIDEVSVAQPPPLPSHVKIGKAAIPTHVHGIHEVFNDISQFISVSPTAAARPPKSNITVEEVIDSDTTTKSLHTTKDAEPKLIGAAKPAETVAVHATPKSIPAPPPVPAAALPPVPAAALPPVPAAALPPVPAAALPPVPAAALPPVPAAALPPVPAAAVPAAAEATPVATS